MNRPVQTVLCGVGGYGGWYTSRFLERPHSPLKFVGFVDPFPNSARGMRGWKKIQALGLPVYDSLESFYSRHEAELAILASPIQFHATQTVCALVHGSHVLTEKPLCATVQEARRMMETRDQTGRIVAVGYQNSFAAETHRLKRDIIAGVWGRPRRCKALAHRPRPVEYYARNDWAGRVRDSRGNWILDSPINNAIAHDLHQMLYLLGSAHDRSAVPAEVQACLCRAHDIDNYDTAFVRCRTEDGTDVFIVASHAGIVQQGPVFELECERGVVRQGGDYPSIRGIFNNGTAIDYGRHGWIISPNKVLDTVAAIRENREPLCGIESAMSQTLCMNGAQESGAPVGVVPSDRIRMAPRPNPRWPDKTNHWLAVDGLDTIIRDAYRACELPNPSIADWLRPGPTVSLKSYNFFPKGSRINNFTELGV